MKEKDERANPDYWENLAEEQGLEGVVEMARAGRVHLTHSDAHAEGVKRFRETQRVRDSEAVRRREAREEETLAVAKSAKLASWIAVGIATLSVLATIATCSS